MSSKCLRSTVTVITAVAAILLSSGCGSGSAARGYFSTADPNVAATFDYTVPAGTMERAVGAAPVEILPEHIEAKVGQTLRITNHDKVGVTAGPFWIAPEHSMAMRFASTGRINGECDLHPSGKLIIDISK